MGSRGKDLDRTTQPEHLSLSQKAPCADITSVATQLVPVEAIFSKDLLGVLLSPVSTWWQLEELRWAKKVDCHKDWLYLHANGRVRL